jgi:hypothetical protein
MFLDLYETHPSFPSHFTSLSANIDLCDEFQSIYNFVFERSLASNASLKYFHSRSQVIVDLIFSEWLLQSDKSIQKFFLKDLHAEVKIQIDEDFKLPFSRLKPVATALDSDLVPDLYKMCRDNFLFGTLPGNHLSRILQASQTLINRLMLNESLLTVSRSNLSVNSGLSVRWLIHLLNSAFDSIGINSLMSHYLGYDVNISGLSIEIGSSKSSWWIPNYTFCDNPSTIYMHRDEGIYCPKCFLYLSHIERSNGAFSVIPNSNDFHGKPNWLQELVGRRIGFIGRLPRHLTYKKFSHIYHQAFGDPIFRSLFRSLPPQTRYSSHYGWDILTHTDLAHNLVSNEVFLEGAPGSFLIFDGSKVTHRALVNATKDHISIQAIFSKKTSLPSKLISKILPLHGFASHN